MEKEGINEFKKEIYLIKINCGTAIKISADRVDAWENKISVIESHVKENRKLYTKPHKQIDNIDCMQATT